MRDWLTIQCEKGERSCLREFIEANPVLDAIMRALLANNLNLSEPGLQKWIQGYQRTASKCLQTYINHVQKGH